jgi:hypothetical protein
MVGSCQWLRSGVERIISVAYVGSSTSVCMRQFLSPWIDRCCIVAYLHGWVCMHAAARPITSKLPPWFSSVLFMHACLPTCRAVRPCIPWAPRHHTHTRFSSTSCCTFQSSMPLPSCNLRVRRIKPAAVPPCLASSYAVHRSLLHRRPDDTVVAHILACRLCFSAPSACFFPYAAVLHGAPPASLFRFSPPSPSFRRHRGGILHMLCSCHHSTSARRRPRPAANEAHWHIPASRSVLCKAMPLPDQNYTRLHFFKIGPLWGKNKHDDADASARILHLTGQQEANTVILDVE